MNLTQLLRRALLTIALAFTAAALALPAPAAAQDETEYDFEDDLVSGDLVRPDGELLNVRRRGRRGSLIRTRQNFVPEMLKSVEDL
ncbi:MAG: hypothetical protein AAF447_09660 [Myxococcota bacterium]